MRYNTDYAKKLRETKTPFNGGLGPYVQENSKIGKNSPLFNPVVAAQMVQPKTPMQPTADEPVVDTSNAIGSLAELLGPTPAEREAMDRKAQKDRAQMQAWAGLFDGLRQLGNLYYTAKGGVPQQFNDNPYQQIENVYEQERAKARELEDYRRQYARQLYMLSRQAGDDERKELLAQARAHGYETKDELARQKAELDRMKAVRVIKQKDGSLWKFDPVTGEATPLKEADPLYQDYVKSQINRNNRYNTGVSRGKNNGTYGYTTMVTQGIDENGNPWKKTERTPTTGEKATNPVKPGVTVTHPKKKDDENKNKGKVDNNVLAGFSIRKKH